MSMCRHETLSCSARLGGGAWCKDCGTIFAPTLREFHAEMCGSTAPVDRPRARPPAEQMEKGKTVDVATLRQTWTLMNRLTGKQGREHEWPTYIEQLKSEGVRIV